jgi:hypothetical protein
VSSGWQKILTVQHNFHHMYSRNSPVSKVIQCWFNHYKESGSAEMQKSPGGLQTSEDDECINLSCHCPKKSAAFQSLQLDIPTMIPKSCKKKKSALTNLKFCMKSRTRVSKW